MKKNNVISKYKNPDKFIARLKEQIDSHNKVHEYSRRTINDLKDQLEKVENKAYGEFWFKLKKNDTLTIDMEDRFYMLNKSFYNTVWISGTIIKLDYQPDANRSTVRFLLRDVYYKEK